MQSCHAVQTRCGRGVGNCALTVHCPYISCASKACNWSWQTSPELDLEHLEVITSFCFDVHCGSGWLFASHVRPSISAATALPKLEAMPKMCKAVSLLACVPLPKNAFIVCSSAT